jgi:hypothetical protein
VACPVSAASPGRAVSRGAALLGASAGAFLLATLGTASVAQAAEPSLNATDVTLAPTPTTGPADSTSALIVPQATASSTPKDPAETSAPVVRQAVEAAAPVLEQAEPLKPAVGQVTETVAPVLDQAEPLKPAVGQVTETVAPVLEQAEPLKPAVGQVTETVAPVLEQAEPLAPAVGKVPETVAPVLEQAEPLVPAVPQPADDGALGVPPPAEGDGRGGIVRRARSDSPASPEVDTAVSGCPMGTAAGPLVVVCRPDPGDRPGENRSPARPEPLLPASTVSPVTPPGGGAPSRSPAAPAPAVPPSTANGGGTSNASPEATVDVASTGLSARAPPAAGQVSGGPRQREQIPPTTPD